MMRMKGTGRAGSVRQAMALLLAWGSLCLPAKVVRAAQEPVTTGVDLLPQVRRLKTLGDRVHLEWLYIEERVDGRPDQKALVRGGGPLEFGEGLLYHGRDGLDEALLAGRADGASYLTRVPHVWAVGPFHNLSGSPAIFVISALGFNRLRDEGKAVLEAEIDKEHGLLDPYPKIPGGIPLDMVREIWIDQDTAERYEALLARPAEGLAEKDRSLRGAIAEWRAQKKLIVIPGLRHEPFSAADFYPAAFEAVGAYFIGKGLPDRIPVFRPRKNPSPSLR